MGLVEETPAVRLEWAVHRPRRPAGIGAWREVLAASAFGIVVDGEVARDQIDLFPIFVNKGCGREHSRRKTQQARAAAAPALFVEGTRKNFLLNPVWIAGWSRPSRAHVDTVEFEMGLVDRHRHTLVD